MYLTPILACEALKQNGMYVGVFQVALSFIYYSSHMLNPNIALTIVLKSQRPFREIRVNGSSLHYENEVV